MHRAGRQAAAADGPALACPEQMQLTFARRGEDARALLHRHRGPLRVPRMLYREGPRCCHALRKLSSAYTPSRAGAR